MKKLKHRGEQALAYSPKGPFIRTWIVPFLMVLVPVVLSCAALRPGCLDIVTSPPHGERFLNWQPPFMPFIWSLLDKLFPWLKPDHISMFYFTMLIYWIGVVGVVRAMIRSTLKALICIVLLGTFPPVFRMLEVISKDSLLMASMFLSYGLLFWAEQKHSKVSFIAAMIALIFAIGVRFNGICAGIPLFLWAGFIIIDEYRWGKRLRRFSRIISASLIGVGLSAAGFTCAVVMSNHISSVNCYPAQQLPLIDLVNMSVMTNQNYVPFLRGIYPEAPRHPYGVNELRQMYEAGSNNRIYWRDPRENPKRPMFQATWNPNEYKILITSWVAAVTHEPVVYLTHRFMMARLLLFVRAGGPGRNFACSHPDAISVQPWGRLAAPLFLYQPCTYFFGACLGLILVFTKLRSRYFRAHLAIAASSLLYAGAYFFVSVNSLDRYLWWSMAAAAILCVQLMIDTNWKKIAIYCGFAG